MMKFIEENDEVIIIENKEDKIMRSVVLDQGKTNVCGICGAKEPFIEYKELEGVHFIWCNKCHTISFFKTPQNEMKKHLIENEMNFYQSKKEP